MSPRTLSARKTRAKKILIALKRLYPEAHIVLNYKNDFELLVAVQLSAQCTDKTVNRITERLFKKYRNLEAYVRADPRQFEKDIRSAGYYRNKTKNILAAARMIKERFGGVVPETMDEMLTLPGVARKTANVVLGNAHGIIEGIAVDTHVRRFAIRFDLSDHKDPPRIEKDLMKILPQEEWFQFTYRIIEYGRHICPARPHPCENHPLTKIFPKAAKVWPLARQAKSKNVR